MRQQDSTTIIPVFALHKPAYYDPSEKAYHIYITRYAKNSPMVKKCTKIVDSQFCLLVADLNSVCSL